MFKSSLLAVQFISLIVMTGATQRPVVKFDRPPRLFQRRGERSS
jgi:hypothetical protein